MCVNHGEICSAITKITPTGALVAVLKCDGCDEPVGILPRQTADLRREFPHYAPTMRKAA